MNEIIKRTIENLTKNGMDCTFVENSTEALELALKGIEKDNLVSVGGSMTLKEIGLIDYLKDGYNFLDRYKEGLTGEEITEIYRKSFFADYYFTSSNAITSDGMLYNVDGNGNRVAAMIYGPSNVIVIAGVNKIVDNLDAAIKRNEEIAAPKNAARLNKKTPCVKTSTCHDCKSPERICREYVVIKKPKPGRIKVILVNDTLGY